jgi:hypothetical protein
LPVFLRAIKPVLKEMAEINARRMPIKSLRPLSYEKGSVSITIPIIPNVKLNRSL